MSQKYDKSGSPILPLDRKIDALRECCKQGWREDTFGHLFDLMAHTMLPHEMWGPDKVERLYHRYGHTPTPIDPPEEQMHTDRKKSYGVDTGDIVQVDGKLCQVIGFIEAPAAMLQEIDSKHAIPIIINSPDWKKRVKPVGTLVEKES